MQSDATLLNIPRLQIASSAMYCVFANQDKVFCEEDRMRFASMLSGANFVVVQYVLGPHVLKRRDVNTL